MIKFTHAHIGYSSSLISIEDLELNDGKTYVLAGKNGVGKTTLLKTIAKQCPLYSGQILINGRSIDQLSEIERSQSIAFVNSTFPHVDFIRVFDFIALGRTPYTNAFGRLAPDDIGRVNEAISALKIDHLRNEFTTNISDGERQLVAIARAFAQDTPIILLDEPTAFLDYLNKKTALELIKKNAEKFMKCVVLSSHDLELCIDATVPFLVVNKDTQQIELIDQPETIQEIVTSAFE